MADLGFPKRVSQRASVSMLALPVALQLVLAYIVMECGGWVGGEVIDSQASQFLPFQHWRCRCRSVCVDPLICHCFPLLDGCKMQTTTQNTTNDLWYNHGCMFLEIPREQPAVINTEIWKWWTLIRYHDYRLYFIQSSKHVPFLRDFLSEVRIISHHWYTMSSRKQFVTILTVTTLFMMHNTDLNCLPDQWSLNHDPHMLTDLRGAPGTKLFPFHVFVRKIFQKDRVVVGHRNRCAVQKRLSVAHTSLADPG